MDLILYSKPGCHLCEGLQEKLEFLVETRHVTSLQVRDITTQDDWYQAYQYEVPVLYKVNHQDAQEELIPRPSPRLTVQQLGHFLLKYI